MTILPSEIRPQRPLTWTPVLPCTLALVLLAGCTQVPFGKQLGLGGDREPVIPNRMVTTWTDTVLQQPGQPGIRGMGGRIMFFAADQKDPVPIDGTLTIYAYDDTSADGEEFTRTAPARKFVFLPDQVPKHYSKSSLGHAYSFWLPWGSTSGPPKKMTLIARFEPNGGGAILSDPATQHLPGIGSDKLGPQAQMKLLAKEAPATTDPEQAGQETAAQAVLQATHTTPVNKHERQGGGLPHLAPAAPAPAARMETITIDLPPGTGQRLAAIDQSGREGSAAAASPPKNTPTRLESGTAAGISAPPAGSPPPTGLAPYGPATPAATDPPATRQRLEAWLAERRQKRRPGGTVRTERAP
jgi:pyruvate/2-oxoglutarate dehydrogenase complex dihydrolipoamide acyltransferase (E2) component